MIRSYRGGLQGFRSTGDLYMNRSRPTSILLKKDVVSLASICAFLEDNRIMAETNGANGHANGQSNETVLPERVIKTELTQYARRRRTDGPYADNLDLDVLIVGAGFSGTYLLYEMRKQGYKTVLYDAGLSFGGTW